MHEAVAKDHNAERASLAQLFSVQPTLGTAISGRIYQALGSALRCLADNRYTARALLTEETIQAVRDGANIAVVVGERIKLTRRGRSLVGLCPFHKEKSPSFHVNEERGFYYCFGCHASGDSIKFIQETEGLAFTEAVRELAGRLNITIIETRANAERVQEESARQRRDELFQVNEAAAEFFERCLVNHPLGHLGNEELSRRALQFDQARSPTPSVMQQTLKAFRVGYAPHSWDALTTHLRSAGLSLKAAESVGLIGARKQGSGFFDRFRHRLMFAVVDLRGRVVAFSGRVLPDPEAAELQRLGLQPLGSNADGNVAKYMNSPESSIYKKRELVFGLYQARDAIRERDECVLVEGNFDVVSLHARGIKNVVAPLGTAFTQEQAAQMRRYSSNVTVLFDADSAGQRASVAAREPCKAEGLAARVAQLPPGTDPDDFVRSKGADALLACLRNAKGMLEFLIELTLESDFRGADAEARGRKLQEVLELIKTEDDPTVRAVARAQADSFAARLGILDAGSTHAVARAVEGAARGGEAPKPSARNLAPERARSQGRTGAIEAEVLGVLVEHPMLLEDAEVQELLRHASGQLALHIAAIKRYGSELSDHLAELDEELRALVGRRLAVPLVDDEFAAREVLFDNLQRLAKADERRGKAEAVEQLRHAAASGDVDTEMELLRRLNDAAQERAQRQQKRLTKV
jgi:DNA primase